MAALAASSKFALMFTQHFLGMQVETKGLISRRKIVRMGPLLSTGTFLFETGAVLGRAMRDRLPAFLYPYCSEIPDNIDLANYTRGQGQKIAALAEDASTITELVMMAEMHKMDATLSSASWSAWMLANGDHEISIEVAGQTGLMFMANGAGFGAEFPGRFEELFFSTYANVDRQAWREANAAGLAIPDEPPEFISLEERTFSDLTAFAEYCAEFYPDYVSSLGLQKYAGAGAPADGGVSARTPQPDSTKSSLRDLSIRELISLLDDAGRRDFVAFSLEQRRPSLHRLVLTFARRTDLALRNRGVSKPIYDLARDVKKRGHVDGAPCLAVVREADVISRDFTVESAEDAIKGAQMMKSDVSYAEAMRAGAGSRQAAAVTASDIALLARDVGMTDAVAAGQNALDVIRLAYRIDARGTATAGRAIAAANVDVGLQTGVNDQAKWLRKRIEQTRR